MTSLSTLADNARKFAQERLGKGVVQDVRVSDYLDEAGEKAYEIIFVVDKFDPNLLTTDARSEIVISIIRKLTEEGDERFPYVRFIPQDELAEVLADD